MLPIYLFFFKIKYWSLATNEQWGLQSGRHGARGDIKGIKKGIIYAQKDIEHVEKDAKHIKLRHFSTFAQTK